MASCFWKKNKKMIMSLFLPDWGGYVYISLCLWLMCCSMLKWLKWQRAGYIARRPDSYCGIKFLKCGQLTLYFKLLYIHSLLYIVILYIVCLYYNVDTFNGYSIETVNCSVCFIRCWVGRTVGAQATWHDLACCSRRWTHQSWVPSTLKQWVGLLLK